MVRLGMVAVIFAVTNVAATELPPAPQPLSKQEIARFKASPDSQHLVLSGEAMSCNDAHSYNKTHDMSTNTVGCKISQGKCVEGSCRKGTWVKGWE